MVAPVRNDGGNEIVFFDVETTVPVRTGQRFWVLEFGAIVVCPRKLVELESYCTLIRPGDLSAVALTSGRSDGITRSAVAAAPAFKDVADQIYNILNGTDNINPTQKLKWSTSTLKYQSPASSSWFGRSISKYK